MPRRQARAGAEAPVCAQCGQRHQRCSGHRHVHERDLLPEAARREAPLGPLIRLDPCRHWPMHGQSVCATHGGMGRNRVAAERQWAKEQAQRKLLTRADRAVRTMGLPVSGLSPQQALLDEIARTAGHVVWLGELIAGMSPEELAWGVGSEEKRTGIGEMETEVDLTTVTKVARPSVFLELYHKERAHLVHVSKVAISCGIAERQVRIAEEQGQLIGQAFRAAFEDPELGLTAVQLEVARVVVARALRSVSSPARPQLSIVKTLPQPPNGSE